MIIMVDIHGMIIPAITTEMIIPTVITAEVSTGLKIAGK